MNKLSKVPSEAIRQAVADVKTCDADPKYTIDMGHWHTPRLDTCHVCLAGAVIAQRTATTPDSDSVPGDHSMARRLLGLDSFRQGNIQTGLYQFDAPVGTWPVCTWDFRDHSTNIPELLEKLLVLADDLEGEGL